MLEMLLVALAEAGTWKALLAVLLLALLPAAAACPSSAQRGTNPVSSIAACAAKNITAAGLLLSVQLCCSVRRR